MLMGFHMSNGYKTIKIEEIVLYGRKSWNFHFFIDNVLYETKNTDNQNRYIKHLEKEYYFEEVEDEQIIIDNINSVREEAL